mmetsp:Transcript_532/g.1261  ORF Transcript_532/g.1261 Transcript_532/m.1261 type:complete len:108 (+) Transcript_532:188-511(+)
MDVCLEDAMGAQSYAWKRLPDGEWSAPEQVSPFQLPRTMAYNTTQPKRVCLVLVGTHCAGKSTIGKKVAAALRWEFQVEVSDELRDKEGLVPGGHLHGDGTGRVHAD